MYVCIIQCLYIFVAFSLFCICFCKSYSVLALVLFCCTRTHLVYLLRLVMRNLQKFDFSTCFLSYIFSKLTMKWSARLFLFHAVIYYIWFLNHHITKSHISCLSSYKIVVHLQRVVWLCLSMNDELYWEILAGVPCFQTRASSYSYRLTLTIISNFNSYFAF